MKVFSKEKYLKRCRELGLSTRDDVHWPDACDGMPVYHNSCLGYRIEDSWCVDVPDPKVSDILDIVKEEKKMYTMKDFIEKPIAVRVGQDHKEEFLKMCEAEGLKWMSGCKATLFTPDHACGEDLCIAYSIPNFPAGLGWERGYQYSLHNITVVDFKDIKPNEPRYQIIIDCDGKTTTAKMMVDGKEVKTGVAKYNPADKFDFSIGAKVAFDRLWDKSEPVKPTAPFKVGDRVKCIKVPDYNKEVVGKYGVVKAVESGNYLPILVEFDEKHKKGHAGRCGTQCKPGCGWWCGIKDLELVTFREVKCPAKVGEYIKIVKPPMVSFDEYEEGDILKVVQYTKGNLPHDCRAYYKDEPFKYAAYDEYVVLEGYVPPVETVKDEPVAKFKVGDRVKCIDSVGFNERVKDSHGTVRDVNPDGDWVEVEFDDNIGGHTLDGKCKDGHGWVCPSKKLKVEQYKEVKRHAKVGEWVKIVKAKGHPAERYKNGAILKVTADAFGGVGAYLTCGGCHCVDSEYVVLEGYKG